MLDTVTEELIWVVYTEDQRPTCQSSQGCSNEAVWRWIFAKTCGHNGIHEYCVPHHDEMCQRKVKAVNGWHCTECFGPSDLVRIERIRA